ncbi:MAG: hypothetical protein MJY84_00620 [Bacteroidales bacterium]|nr:hypothetical protein [Bacteroidales bacterium]
MKKLLTAAFMAAMVLGGPMNAQAQTVDSDWYAATDALGRKVGRYDDTKKDKTVIMFYWTWHQMADETGTYVKNIAQTLKTNPEAANDYDFWHKDNDDYCYWDEPIFGYYRTTDKWVLRKHAEMLADAKIDAVFFDCSNGSMTWDESTDALCEAWDQAQKDGVNVPKIGFLLPFSTTPGAKKAIRHLYERMYSKGLYENLWFYWDGKPCIFAYPSMLDENDEEEKAIKEFFTFRPMQPDYVMGQMKDVPSQWSWLENYPQHGFNPKEDGTCEQVSVGVAQNACDATGGHCSAFNLPGTYSRSYTYRNGYDQRPDAYLWGANFEEQWDRAYELDPDVVFVTGWNEWIAGCWKSFAGKPEPPAFVDEFDWDHSRDIEPTKAWGNFGDVYYLQLVDKVRKFKGTSPAPEASAPKSIRLRKTGDWDDVLPNYTSYKGNTAHRDALGKADIHYVDETGRNDIVGAKVARDDEYVWFYVETEGKLTSRKDKNWMMLFLDVDRDKSTGWEGYEYVVNYKNPKCCRTTVSKNSSNGAWEWEDAASVKYTVKGDQLVIRIPRSLDPALQGALDFEFKWVDNMQDEGNPMDFYVSGDVAPLGRFNYVYTAE